MAIEKYTTEAIVIDIYDNGEHDRVYKFFTYDFGMILAHGKSIRKIESKLRAHLMIGRKSLITLVAGREVWRITGATDMSERNAFLQEIISILGRLIRGEGAHKGLYKKIMTLSQVYEKFDAQKVRILAYFIILVDLGYANAEVIGAKNLEEYIAWSVDDLYTHMLLNIVQVKKHIHTVMSEIQL